MNSPAAALAVAGLLVVGCICLHGWLHRRPTVSSYLHRAHATDRRRVQVRGIVSNFKNQ